MFLSATPGDSGGGGGGETDSLRGDSIPDWDLGMEKRGAFDSRQGFGDQIHLFIETLISEEGFKETKLKRERRGEGWMMDG